MGEGFPDRPPVDTGPLIAYLDSGDGHHKRVSEFFSKFTGHLITTSAVIMEAMYFLSDIRNGPVALADLLVSAGAHIEEFAEPRQVLAAAKLMDKYSDIPMDFADATLKLAGERLGILEIHTLDRRGFAAFRTSAGKAFRVVA